ncbi:MAG: hypothetical protein QOJ64_1247 [Acidobacteriota bacterium]|jgi:hypothetical protein|nr:hypothetical protein [Acidobacteriota bacterium]
MKSETGTPVNRASTPDDAGSEQEDELAAEQESAAAMDADVPQSDSQPDDAATTEGQPS